MSAEDIETLFTLRSVVLAAPNPNRAAHFTDELRAAGFTGDVVDWATEPVRHDKPAGVILWPRLDAEMVLLRMKAHGCRTVVLIGPAASGGEDARRAHRRLKLFARRLGLRVVGPSRMGVILPRQKLVLGTWSPVPAPGPLALLTRSDSLAAALLAAGEREGIGFSRVISLGEADDTELADIIDALAMDAETRAILLHVDTLYDPRSFLSAARAASHSKPIVALRTGAAFDPKPSGVTRAAALVRRERILDAVFLRAGIVQAETFEAMADAAEILGHGRAWPPPDPKAAPRIALVSNGSGPAAIAADAIVERGGQLVATADGRPRDLGAGATAADYAAAVEEIIASRAADAIVVLHWPAPGAASEPVAADLVRLAAKRSAYRPARVVAVLLGGRRDEAAHRLLRAGNVPAYETPERAVRAVMTEIAHVRRQAALASLPEASDEADRGYARTLRAWSEGVHATGPDGVVLLDADAARPVTQALDVDIVSGGAPGARGFTLGLVRDPTFGGVIVVAPAGRFEADTPCAVALPPLDATLARLVLGDLRLGRTLLNTQPEAAQAVIGRLIALAEVAAEAPAIAEITLEGVEWRDGRLTITHAQVAVDPGRARAVPGDDLVIRPYPRALERTIALRDGRRALLRPVRPEDARVLQRLFAKLTPEDRRLRLFVPLKELSDAMAARLTQIDYDREMCFVVEDPDGSGDLLAGARIVCDADGDDAEYAVTVRSDLKGHGLGRTVLGRVLEYAREKGIKRVWGTVLAENRGMLALADTLGMTKTRDPDDPDLVKTAIEFTGEA